MKKIMVKYLELQTNIQISKAGFVNDFTNLYKGDVLTVTTDYFTKEDNITSAIYQIKHHNYIEYIEIPCDGSSRVVIDKHNLQNDSTLLYMLINMSMVIEITTQYNRNRLIDDVLSI